MRIIKLEDGREVKISEESYNELAKAIRDREVTLYTISVDGSIAKVKINKSELVEVARDPFSVCVKDTKFNFIYLVPIKEWDGE